jgi:hypothetical protein
MIDGMRRRGDQEVGGVSDKPPLQQALMRTETSQSQELHAWYERAQTGAVGVWPSLQK